MKSCFWIIYLVFLLLRGICVARTCTASNKMQFSWFVVLQMTSCSNVWENLNVACVKLPQYFIQIQWDKRIDQNHCSSLLLSWDLIGWRHSQKKKKNHVTQCHTVSEQLSDATISDQSEQFGFLEASPVTTYDIKELQYILTSEFANLL